MSILLAEELHDIAPPVDYSLIPTWLLFIGVFVALTIIGLIIWLLVRSRKSAIPAKSARERALEELDRLENEIEKEQPYRFSIRISDVLRQYVTEQFHLPVMRQTSVEFLTALALSSPFSEDERMLLEDFLNRCDLIKFARYESTSSDSRQLLEEATRFVKGGEFAIASV
ncbi:MAG: DUF4381 family protein [Verrucomicrobiota bacterium]